jgi:hypothetical protein
VGRVLPAGRWRSDGADADGALISAFGDSRSAALSGWAADRSPGSTSSARSRRPASAKCRAPLTFFLQHWEEGPFRNGLRFGAVCLGCCWALMLLAFVGGVMNLAFMGLATLVMALEKLTWIGAVITRPLGGLLIAGGILTLAAAIV